MNQEWLTKKVIVPIPWYNWYNMSIGYAKTYIGTPKRFEGNALVETVDVNETVRLLAEAATKLGQQKKLKIRPTREERTKWRNQARRKG